MKKRIFAITFFALVVINVTGQNLMGKENYDADDLNQLSIAFLENIKLGKNTATIKQQLASISIETFQRVLNTDSKKIAFWVNIYNAFIQDILNMHPELYEDRGDFFSREQINIAGGTISFDKIEHGILRRSQSKLGLGYVGKIFIDRLERELRVSEIDYRIHFALNCGAKDCPPIGSYYPEHLEEQLQSATQKFLTSSTSYDNRLATAKVTSLFSWFRGDFGGIDGVKSILREHELIPKNTKVDLQFKDYDWTLDLNNFIDL